MSFARSRCIALRNNSSTLSLRWRMPRQPIELEIVAVDEAAECSATARLVAVDVVERRAGIEAGALAERDALGKEPADPHVEPHQRPIEPARGEQRQRRRERVGLVARIAHAIGVEQRGPARRLGEALEDEPSRAGDRDRAAELAEGVVVEARQDMAFLDGRSQPLVESMLRTVMHDPVGARDEQLGRHRDRACVGHHALGGLVEAEQDVDGDRTRDQRIGPVRGDALGIVGEELRLDVGVDEEIAHGTCVAARAR